MKAPDVLNALVIKAFFFFLLWNKRLFLWLCSLFIYLISEAPRKLLPVPRLTSAGDVRLTRFPGRPAAGCQSPQPMGWGVRWGGGQGTDPGDPGSYQQARLRAGRPSAWIRVEPLGLGL